MTRRKENDTRLYCSVRLEPELHAKATAAAEERVISMNLLITRALKYYLERLIPVDEVKWTRD